MAKNVRLAHVYTEKQLKTARTEVRARAVLFTREHEANEWNRLIFMLPCCNIVFPRSESLLKAVFLQLNGCMYRLDVSLNFSRWCFSDSMCSDGYNLHKTDGKQMSLDR